MTPFGRGDLVVDPEDPAKVAVIVGGPAVVGGVPYFEVLLASQERVMLPESELRRKDIDRNNPASWLVDRPLVDPYSLSRALTHFKLTSALTDIIYSFSSARTLFRPHQFKPVLKVIESPVHRLLLADEVGLGKTIEAGLIWTELDARSPLRRVLIVTPSSLIDKWQMEMERRFDRETRVLSSRDFVEFAERYADRGDSVRLAGVMSYPQLRNKAVVEVLNSRPPTFDLAIFDEAHALRNHNTQTHRAGELVAQNTEALIFLSATPVNLGSDDLYNLLHLLRPDEFSRRELFASEVAPNAHVNAALRALTSTFPPNADEVLEALRGVESTAQADVYRRNPIYQHVVRALRSEALQSRRDVVELQEELAGLNTLADSYTRTRKRDVQDQQVVRRATHLSVELSEDERGLYEATLALVTELRMHVTGAAPGLAAIMPARQASSCLPAMRNYVDLLAERGSFALDLTEGEEEDEDDESWTEVEVRLQDRARMLAAEVRTRSAQLRGADSKFERLVGALTELEATGGRRQVLLFSFFRLTLGYLDRELSALGYRCAQMHGGIPRRDRTELLRRFRAGDLDVLLCSEVGSEGLDFEFCDVIVNYDLPWNPMRLEQRIGRLDRFGQRHEVINIFNFEIDGTIDTDIFLRLYRRIGIFESSIGELEPILGTTAHEITREIAAVGLTADEQQALADRLAHAVELEQRSLERFDEEQDRLVGADAFIEDALQDARENRRYLTPDELSRYVGGFLRSAAHPAKLEAIPDRPGILALYGSRLLADQLREHGRNFLTPTFSELITSVETGGPIEVTFDSERAYDASAEFVSNRHPLVRAISVYHGADETSIHPGGYVRLAASEPVLEGRWIFYIFLLAATGLLPQRSLVAVAARLDDREVSMEVGEHVLAWLAGPDVTRMREQDIPLFDREAAIDCYQAVLGHVAAEREESKVRLSERNDALITSRQGSLERELATRSARLHEMAYRPDVDERIHRMRLGQMANLENDIRARIAGLDAQRDVSVSFRVVLGGLADLVPG